MAYELRSARFLAAAVMDETVQPGDTAVDATVGNGYDTCRLAGLVGETGRVIGFDIQPEALASARRRLEEEGLAGRCELHLAGHERMGEFLTGPVRLVSFNLGWLPGGDKRISTRWTTTRVAVEAALSLLMPMGVCLICVYPGHAAGEEERQQLIQWLATLRPQEYNVLHQRFLNAGPGAPECIVIQRQPGREHEQKSDIIVKLS